ncbi:MAG: peptidoglycan DD-metalloendopeptidase family protein [Thermodesulfobacteriota bacterium]
MQYYFKEDPDLGIRKSLSKRVRDFLFSNAKPLFFGSSFLAISVFSFFLVSGSLYGNPQSNAIIDSVFKNNAATPPALPETFEVIVKGNGSFYAALFEIGFSSDEAAVIVKKTSEIYDPRMVREGDVFKAVKTNGRIESVEYRHAPLEGLLITPDESSEGGFLVARFEAPSTVTVKSASGVIDNSLYASGIDAGLPPEIIMELSDIFAWDVDFSTETRKGDSFAAVYESVSTEGKEIGSRRVLAAEVVNSGKTYAAIYYEDKSGKGEYYDEEGRSISRTLLKSPLRYRRISSYFSKKRYHPIKKVFRPHHGIDYAAPSGTPVETAGTGRVVFAGWKSGYGNFVVVRHNSNYETAYGHFKAIKKGIKKGIKVEQGDVIGYVGSTGISTGPHLHYEVRVRGKMVNPLSVKAEPRRRLNAAEMASFSLVRDLMMAKMSEPKTVVAYKN